MTAIEKAAQAFIDRFLQEVGYHEKATNAQLDDKTANSGSNNWNKFAAFIDSLRELGLNFYNGRKNIGPNGEWCDISFDTVMIWFIMALGIDKIEAAKLAMKMLYQPSDSCGAGCVYSANYYRAAGAWVDRSGTPKVGDQFFIGKKYDETHTGGVAKVDATYIYTVEGNYSNQVSERKIRRDDTSIAGYGRPNFALVAKYFEEPEPAPAPKYITKEQCDLMITDICGKWIGDIKDIPHKSVEAIARTLLDLEAVDGGTPYSVNPDDIRLPYNILRAIVIAKRYTDKAIEALREKDE